MRRKRLRDLTRRDCSDWIMDRVKDGVNPTTVNRDLVVCKGFFEYLHAQRYIAQNPMAGIVPLITAELLPRVISEDDVDRLLRVPDVSTYDGLLDRAMIELLYATGMRVSELVTLTVKDIYRTKRIIKCTGKGGRQRLVIYGKEAQAWINIYLAVRNELSPGQCVFLKASGAAVTPAFIWRRIKICGKKLGLDEISPHWLRHSFATHMLEHGASTLHLQQLLGHSGLDSTQIYTHLTIKHLREAYDRFHPRARLRQEMNPSFHNFPQTACQNDHLKDCNLTMIKL